MIPPERILAVLLAAGLSRRFGAEDKLVAPYRGKPLALHAAGTLTALPCAGLVAVCRNESALTPLLTDLGFTIRVNDQPERGQAHSLALAAIAAMAAGAEAMLICLADMPEVTPALLEEIAARFEPDEPAPVATASGDYRGPPVLFPAHLFPALAALDGDRGARHLLTKAIWVETPPAAVTDFDTPEDFRIGQQHRDR
jgi:molybdenum cofactor cytidylyltransferase